MEAGALRKLIYDTTKVDIVNANNEFKSTYQILLEISKVWKNLDDMTKATLLEKIAGKHRASVVASLLNDSETMISAYEDALKSAGSAEEEYLKRTESVEFHLKQLTAAWQELSTSAASVEFINGIIDKLRELIELINNLGVQNVALTFAGAASGLGTTAKLLPFLEGIGEEAKQKNEQIKVLGKSFDWLAGKGPKTAGAIKLIATSLKGLVIGAVGTVALFGFLTLVDYILEKYDDWQNEASDTADEIETLESKIKNLHEEYELLSGKEVLTDVEKERLEVLKEEIALQEADLSLSKKRLSELNAEKYSGTVTAINYDTGYQKEVSVKTADQHLAEKVDESTKSYLSAENELKKLRQELDSATEAYDRAAKGTETYAERAKIVSELGKEIAAVESEKNIAHDEMISNYNSLVVQQSELENIINDSIGLTEDEVAAYQKKLDATKSEIELQKILLGLEGANADFGKQQIELYDTYKKTTGIIDKLNTGHEISREKLAHLEKEFPGLIDATLKYGDEANGAYTLSKESLETLNSVQATSLANMNDNELARTIVAKENALKRVTMYQAEATAIGQLSQAMASIQGGNQGLLDEAKNADSLVGKVAGTLKWAAAATQTASVEGYQLWSAGDKLNDKLKDAQAEADSYAAQIQGIIDAINGIDPTKSNNGTEDGDGPDDGDDPGDGSTSGTSKSADIWDKYAHALADANDEIERYNKNVEITQAKLDKNQSFENRTVELLGEEVRLYDELIANTKSKYQIVNDTLWAQQQGLKQMYEEAAKYMNVDADTVANMTDADLEAHIELKLDEDKANDQKIAHLLNGIIDMRQSVHDLHIDWLNMKSEINSLNREVIEIKVKFSDDIAEKFDEARKNSESLLDILEEMEGTEGQRLSIIEGLINSYETELSATMALHKETSEEIVRLAKENKQNTDEYNDLLDLANKQSEHALEVIQEEYEMRKKQLDVEKERAIVAAETSIYGEQGKEAWEKAREREIKRLQDQLEALEEDTSEADYLEEIAEKEETIAKLEEKVANLRSEKTIKMLEEQEDGSFQWTYVEDQRAINETLEELEDAKNDLKKRQEEKALEDEKKAIQDEIDAIEESIESKQEQYDLELEEIEQYYQDQLELQQKYMQEQINLWMQQITEMSTTLDDLGKKTEGGLDKAASKAESGMNKLWQAYDDGFSTIISGIGGYVDDAIDEINRMEAAIRELEMAKAEALEDDDIDGSHANGLKFVDSNNYIARLHYGERVLTRQEAEQYNELEEDIKSGKLQEYFDSLQNDTALSISNVAATAVSRNTNVPLANNSSTSFVIERLELPNVQDPTDFASVLNDWARGEFGGLAQKARIVSAR